MRSKYLCLLFLAATMACTGNKNSVEDNDLDTLETVAPFTFDTLQVRRAEKVIPGREYPQYEVKCKAVFATDTTVWAGHVNQLICDFLFCRQDGEPQAIMQAVVDSIATSFRDDLQETYITENEDYDSFYSYSADLTGTTVENALSGYLVYECYTYSFTGGAHGLYNYKYLNVREKDGMVMHKADVFAPDSDAAVVELIVQQLIADNDCKTLEQLQEQTAITLLGEPTIEEENFELLKDGVKFTYNVYEIAPYATGEITVTVPYTALKDYLVIEL